ncbi:hypothetical protein ZIOFF_051236 [Zingiber officinale]|uniref:Deoxyuridine 5'-triphosphate nucleotidohydrolase n=1 Tax=Zingiber officinale TaxID=94328 RepID=A0A8J5G1Z4_ZINOF|nr:hypothetical protein ZIOFF_051236 [Zingiber officinale]
MQSTEVNNSNLLDGRITLSFHNYTAAPILRPPLYNNHDEEVPSDEERLLTHTITVLIEESMVQVKRLTRIAEIPKRQLEEAAGYDLMADEECTIEPCGRGLVSTGLCLAIPSGFYGRIATWSDAALKLGLHVGARVIDSDYRASAQSANYQYPNPQRTYAGATRPGPAVLRSIGNLAGKATEYITTLCETDSEEEAEIAESLRDIQTDLKTILEQTRREVQTSSIPYELIDKLKNLSLGTSEKPKERRGLSH